MNKVISMKKQSMLMLNDFYGKSMTNFNFLGDGMNEFMMMITNDNKLKENFLIINNVMNETKNIFQSFYSSLSEYLKVPFTLYKKDDQQDNLNSNSKLISTNTTNNSNYNQNKIKSSYEKIDNEFQKIEKVTKELNIVRKNNEQLRKNRIKLLESKLQDFCDEVKNIRFSDLLPSQLERVKSDNNISKIFENSVSINDLNNKMNEVSSMPSYTITVENNNTISDYESSKNTKLTKLNQNIKDGKNMIPLAMYKKNKRQSSKSTKQRPISINEVDSVRISRAANHPRKDNEIFIDQIMDLNMDNKSEMINLIESLIGKDESESNSKFFDHSKYDEKFMQNTIKKDN